MNIEYPNNLKHIILTPQEWMLRCGFDEYALRKIWGKEKIKTEKLRSIIRKAKQNDR